VCHLIESFQCYSSSGFQRHSDPFRFVLDLIVCRGLLIIFLEQTHKKRAIYDAVGDPDRDFVECLLSGPSSDSSHAFGGTLLKGAESRRPLQHVLRRGFGFHYWPR